jgi:hypothetical protein
VREEFAQLKKVVEEQRKRGTVDPSTFFDSFSSAGKLNLGFLSAFLYSDIPSTAHHRCRTGQTRRPFPSPRSSSRFGGGC